MKNCVRGWIKDKVSLIVTMLSISLYFVLRDRTIMFRKLAERKNVLFDHTIPFVVATLTLHT